MSSFKYLEVEPLVSEVVLFGPTLLPQFDGDTCKSGFLIQERGQNHSPALGANDRLVPRLASQLQFDQSVPVEKLFENDKRMITNQ